MVYSVRGAFAETLAMCARTPRRVFFGEEAAGTGGIVSDGRNSGPSIDHPESPYPISAVNEARCASDRRNSLQPIINGFLSCCCLIVYGVNGIDDSSVPHNRALCARSDAAPFFIRFTQLEHLTFKPPPFGDSVALIDKKSPRARACQLDRAK